MDVLSGLLWYAALVACLYLAAVGAGWVRAAVSDRRGRARRRVQLRRADRWWHDLEGQAALAAMRDVVDRVDGEAKP